ncbi:hypothetical protein BB560_004520, partial [Smittium megazygosporum]
FIVCPNLIKCGIKLLISRAIRKPMKMIEVDRLDYKNFQVPSKTSKAPEKNFGVVKIKRGGTNYVLGPSHLKEYFSMGEHLLNARKTC